MRLGVAEDHSRHTCPSGRIGAAHIVWDDDNFGREHVQWCLDEFEQYKQKDASDAENEAVRQSLIELLALTDDVLDPEPEDYDGEHPEMFPPTVEMAHR